MAGEMFFSKPFLKETKTNSLFWAIFGDHIDLHNLNSSFQEINNDILILLQTSTFAIYLTIKT